MGHHTRKQKILLIASVLSMLLLGLGCTLTDIGLQIADIGPLQRESLSVKPEDAESVNATVRMSAGQLDIQGGAEALLEANFTYNVIDWEPEVTYEVSDRVGDLDVRHVNNDNIPITGDVRNEWDLRFNEEIPLDLRVECGAGEHRLDLKDLTLTDLDLKLGAGDMDLRLGNNGELDRVDLDIGAGDVEIDLTGPWSQDARFSIQGGVGQTRLSLPSDTGVRVTITQGIGDIDVSGLTREGGAWVNGAYGNTDVALEIDIQAGIGQINLETD